LHSRQTSALDFPGHPTVCFDEISVWKTLISSEIWIYLWPNTRVFFSKMSPQTFLLFWEWANILCRVQNMVSCNHFWKAINILENRQLRFCFLNFSATYFLFYFISFAKENRTYNVIKLKKGVGRDTATAEANYSGPGLQFLAK